MMEHKGINSQMIKDFNRFIFLTNNDWTIRVDYSDRRFLYLDLTNEVACDITYFNVILALINDERRGLKRSKYNRSTYLQMHFLSAHVNKV